MPGLYELRFSAIGQTQLFAGSRGNYYEFPDGTRLDLLTTPAWCYGCRQIVCGEKVESIQALDQQLAELRNPRSDLYRFLAKDYADECKNLGEAFTHKHSAERERRRRWLIDRVSPPRCILCGSTDILVFPFDRAIRDPAGRGLVVLSLRGMCSTDSNEWFFTPEGERIPRDTKPTCWHHPALDNSPGVVRRWIKHRMTRGRGST